MKLVHPNIDQHILIEENKIPLLIVENQKCFASFARSFHEQINGESGNFVLSHENEPLAMDKKMVLIPTLVPFEINQRTHINKLYQRLKDVANDGRHYVETQNLIQSLEGYIYSLENDLDFGVELGENFDISTIFKGFSVKLAVQGNLAEQLIDYMQITNDLLGEKIYVIINLRSFLDDFETELFYQTILAKKHHVLLLESSSHKPLLYENRIIIDEDLCEI